MILDAIDQGKINSLGSGEVLVSVENVSKKFCRSLRKSLWYGVQDISCELIGKKNSDTLRNEEFWALKDVSFELRRGECLGLLGCNGAGKSTLLRMINGLIKPDQGRIETRGQVAGLIALGAGFNPILTGRENIYVYGSVLGFSKKEIDAKFEEIVDFAELEKYIDTPVQSYSSGMSVRLGFAIAVILINPDILILDEVLAVGDRAFRSKCMIKIGELLHNSAVIFVSHQENLIQRICNSALWLESGRVKEYGDQEIVLSSYLDENIKEGNLKLHPKINHNGTISSILVKPEVSNIHIGSDIKLLVQISCLKEQNITHFYLTLSDEQSTCVARSDLSCNFIIREGKVLKLELIIKNLCLKRGRYFVRFYGFAEKQKIQVFEIINSCSFRVSSDIISNIPYLPIAEVRQFCAVEAAF